MRVEMRLDKATTTVNLHVSQLCEKARLCLAIASVGTLQSQDKFLLAGLCYSIH